MHSLIWKNHKNYLTEGIQRLFEEDALLDCALSAEDQYIKGHKVILAACSPYLDLLFREKCDSNTLVLKDLKFSDLKFIIDYIYKGEIEISSEELSSFLVAASVLQIKGFSSSYKEQNEHAKVKGNQVLENNEKANLDHGDNQSRHDLFDGGCESSRSLKSHNSVLSSRLEKDGHIISADDALESRNEENCNGCNTDLSIKEEYEILENDAIICMGDNSEQERESVVGKLNENSSGSANDDDIEDNELSDSDDCESVLSLRSRHLVLHSRTDGNESNSDLMDSFNMKNGDNFYISVPHSKHRREYVFIKETDNICEEYNENNNEYPNNNCDANEELNGERGGLQQSINDGEMSHNSVIESRVKCYEMAIESKLCDEGNTVERCGSPTVLNVKNEAKSPAVASLSVVKVESDLIQGGTEKRKGCEYSKDSGNNANSRLLTLKYDNENDRSQDLLETKEISVDTFEIDIHEDKLHLSDAESCSDGSSKSSKANESSNENVNGNIQKKKKKNRSRAVKTQYLCQICNKSHPSRSKLASHERTHTGVKPFHCKQCNKLFSEKGSLNKHLKVHNGEKPYKCQDCDKHFSHLSSLAYHQHIHTGNKPFHCLQCNKQFPTKGSFYRHLKVHTGEKPYKCLDCGKSFTCSSSLLYHQRLHTGEKPFKCPHCDKQFTNKRPLNRHLKIHTEGKSLKCQFCDKHFLEKDSLVIHERIHTGEKPYKCLDCDKLFIARQGLARHQKIHTSGPI